jgi:hypothetical protein
MLDAEPGALSGGNYPDHPRRNAARSTAISIAPTRTSLLGRYTRRAAYMSLSTLTCRPLPGSRQQPTPERVSSSRSLRSSAGHGTCTVVDASALRILQPTMRRSAPYARYPPQVIRTSESPITADIACKRCAASITAGEGGTVTSRAGSRLIGARVSWAATGRSLAFCAVPARIEPPKDARSPNYRSKLRQL